MALEGTLRDFSFADILQLISLQRKTGVLTLKCDDNVVTISFLDGCIVGASSLNQHIEDRIGLILLKRGELTEEELEAGLRRQEETLQRLGRILIDHRVAARDAVRAALEQQILQIVFRVFRWLDGEYHFSQETDIDYDRDLMHPMAADSIIMEGARMTDEWPFIDQRIPSREIVFVKVDPHRKFEIVEEEEEDFDDLGFGFTETPEEAKSLALPEDRMTENQHTAYQLVNGRDSVTEIILESPLIEFETCKALADLIERSLIREATQEEVVRQLSRESLEVRRVPHALPHFPWLAVPFLVLLGFSISVMTHNPINPIASARDSFWQRYVLESASWFWMRTLGSIAEDYYFLNGVYPDDPGVLAGITVAGLRTVDPWDRHYRLVTRGHKLLITGSDSSGQPVPMLILSRPLVWEGEVATITVYRGPGVRLLD